MSLTYIGKFLLGFCYLSGTGCVQNREKGLHLTREAATDGRYGPAMTNLAREILKMNPESSESKSEALYWYTRAATETGVASAQFELGKLKLNESESNLNLSLDGQNLILSAAKQGHQTAVEFVRERGWRYV